MYHHQILTGTVYTFTQLLKIYTLKSMKVLKRGIKYITQKIVVSIFVKIEIFLLNYINQSRVIENSLSIILKGKIEHFLSSLSGGSLYKVCTFNPVRSYLFAKKWIEYIYSMYILIWLFIDYVHCTYYCIIFPLH